MTESFNLCINGERYFHRTVKKEISPPFELLPWLESQQIFPKCYWQDRDGLEIAAIGSVLTLGAVPEFDLGNDSPARFWGGHGFSTSSFAKDDLWKDFPNCSFFLPQYELVHYGDRLELSIHAINGALQEDLSLTGCFFQPSHPSLKSIHHLPSQENWQELLQNALNEMGATVLEKVVLARRSTHLFNHPLSALEILSKIKANLSTRFALQFSESSTFIGATPERLYKRQNHLLYTEAVAGTRKRGQTTIEDRLLEKELLESPKEMAEFSFAKTSIEAALKPLCINLNWETQDHVIKTPNVQHLHNTLEGKLFDGVLDKQILTALHPTASIGGFPRLSALEHLIRYEPFERGWYAGPVGYLSQEKAEFAVGIRSGLVTKNELHLFAGAGIVSGSLPNKEWDELEHKTALWRNICKLGN